MTRLKAVAIVLVFQVLFYSGGFLAPAHADVESTVLSTLNLEGKPLDIAASADGKLIFVLTAGEVVIYEKQSKKITGRLAVDKGVEQITVSPRGDELYATNADSKTLSVITVDFIYDIDVSGLPFKGPDKAPVVIAVFDDYQ